MTQPKLFDWVADDAAWREPYVFRCIQNIPHGHVWTNVAVNFTSDTMCQCGARRYGDAPEPAKTRKGRA